MTLHVKLFARARDLAGASEVTVTLPAGATVAQLRSALGQTMPSLSGFLDRCAVAVNSEFADDGFPVHEGDEVALLPPVSGG
jgi:molybdopterin synthase sulfur carrier subunit